MGRRSHRQQWGNQFTPDSAPYIFKRSVSQEGYLRLYGSAWFTNPQEHAHLAAEHIEGDHRPSFLSRRGHEEIIADVRILDDRIYIVLLWKAGIPDSVVKRAQDIIRTHKGMRCQDTIIEKRLFNNLYVEVLDALKHRNEYHEPIVLDSLQIT